MIDKRYLALQQDIKLPIWEFFILVFIYEEQYEFLELARKEHFMEFARVVQVLENYSYVKWHGNTVEDISLRKHGEDLFRKHVGARKKITTAKEIETWIDAWRELFPEGKNTAGFRYRGNRGEAVKKMVKFVNDNSYSTEQIFHATRHYVDTYSQKGFAYMQQAHYFIEKKGVGSTLSSYCEELDDNKFNEKEEDTYGRSVI